jgi:hypothetical protein
MPYLPEFLQLLDKFIHLANDLAERGNDGEVGAAEQVWHSVNERLLWLHNPYAPKTLMLFACR